MGLLKNIVIGILLAFVAVVLAIVIFSPNNGDVAKMQKEKKKQENKATQILEKLKNRRLTKGERIIFYLQLYKIYMEGIPDKYAEDGTKVDGVDPNVGKAIKYMTRAIKLGYHRGYIILGRLMLHGTQYLSPDYGIAMAYFVQAKELLTDPVSLGEIEAEEARLRELTEVDGADDYVVRTCPVCHLELEGPVMRGTDMNPMEPGECPRCRVDYEREERENVALVRDFILGQVHRPHAPQVRVREGLWQNNSQNSHDHAVVTGVKNTIRMLDRDVKIEAPFDQAFKEAREYVKSNYTNEAIGGLTNKGSDIMKVLNHMRKHGDQKTTYGGTEWDVFVTSWNKARKEEDMKHNFMEELSTAVESGAVVCTGGRIGRMVNSFNGVDPSVKIVQTDEIKREMMDKAPIIRNALLDQYDADQQTEIEAIDTNPTQVAFNMRFKEEMTDTFKKDYSGVALDSMIDEQVNMLVSAVA